MDIALKHDPLRKCAFIFLGSLSITSLKSSNAFPYFFNFITKINIRIRINNKNHYKLTTNK